MQASSVAAPASSAKLFDFDVNLRRDRGAIDEKFALRVHEQIVAAPAKISRIAASSVTTVMMTSASAVTSPRSWLAAQPSSCASVGRGRAIHVVNRGDVKSAILQSARHVRAHPADANETNVHIILIQEGRRLRPSAKERIVLFLFANGRHRPVPGTNDRFVRQGQNFLADCFCTASS